MHVHPQGISHFHTHTHLHGHAEACFLESNFPYTVRDLPQIWTADRAKYEPVMSRLPVLGGLTGAEMSYYRPAAARSWAARSMRSQEKSGSERPK